MEIVEHTDDDELLRRYARDGDQKALGLLFKRHVDSAYATARRVCRNPADAEDAVQVAFMKVMKNASKFRGGGDLAVRSWIMKTVIGTCKDSIRSQISRRKREETVAEEHADHDSSMDLQETDLTTCTESILMAIDLLPSQFRAAIWLHHHDGLSVKDAAELLHVPENTFKSNVYRGMRELRSRLVSQGITATEGSLAAVVPAIAAEAAPGGLLTAVLDAAKTSSATTANLSGLKSLVVIPKSSVFAPIAILVLSVSILAGAVYFALKHEVPTRRTATVPAPVVDIVPDDENAEYVDGPVVLEDKFENGLGAWQLVCMNQGRTNFPEQVAKNISLRRCNIRGRPGVAAAVKGAAGMESIGLWLDEPWKKCGAFSMEYDLTCFSECIWDFYRKNRGRAFQSGVSAPHIKAGLDQWVRVRVEVVPRRDPAGVRFYMAKTFYNGPGDVTNSWRNADVYHFYFDGDFIGFGVSRGECAIANVCIRKMVPVRK